MDKLIALGVISVLDMDDVGVEPLVSELGIGAEFAKKLVNAAVKEVKAIASESKQKQAADIPARGPGGLEKEAGTAQSEQQDQEEQEVEK